MNRCLIIVMLLIVTVPLQAQKDCALIVNSDQYFSATSMAKSEPAARADALSLLVNRISTVVSSRSDIVTRDVNNVAEQVFYDLTSSVSQLHLNGVNYLNCRERKGEGITVVAYISKEDLKKSAEEVSKQVYQYLDLMEQKKAIGIDFLSEAYTAYLYTFFTPYAIPYQQGSDKISNVQSYLESILRGYLATIRISSGGVVVNPDYPDDHLVINLQLAGVSEKNMRFIFECPTYSARAEISQTKGAMDVIMQPGSRVEKFKGTLMLKPTLIASDLKDMDSQITIGKDVEFDADMSGVISIDFTIKEDGNDFILVPVLRHVSVRKLEWSSMERRLSTDQRPRISKTEIGNEITLRVNENMVVKRTTNGLGSAYLKKVEELKNPDVDQRNKKDLPAGSAVPNLSLPYADIQTVDTFSQLQAALSKLKQEGKVMVGKKSDFYKPANCWVFLVEPATEKLIYSLSPESNGRMDMRTRQSYLDFEIRLKGFISIWAEFY